MIFNSIKEKSIYYNLPVLLFSILPFSLITGPLLSDFSISLISILFLIYCKKHKNFSFFNNEYFYIFIFFWLYLIVNSLINNLNFDSLKISFFYIRYGIFVIAITALINTDAKFIKYFFYCIFTCFTILVIDGFYQYFVGENILGLKSQNIHRVSSFFHEELILGSYLSRLWPIFFGLTLIVLKKKNRLFYFVISIFILSEALIFLSGDRSAFFYINFSAIFVIVLAKNLQKLRIVTLICSLFIITIISLINPTAKERIIDITLKDMNVSIDKIRIDKNSKVMNFFSEKNKNDNDNDNDNGMYIFSKQHTHHYITAYKMFLDNKILGVGVKNFRNFCNDEKYNVSILSCSTHPHNTYVQILSETGLIGFLFLILILLYFCSYIMLHLIGKFKGRYYFSDFDICVLSGIAIYLFPVIPTGNVFNNWLNIIFILYLPFLLCSKNLSKI
jgi:O-antigen ligase